MEWDGSTGWQHSHPDTLFYLTTLNEKWYILDLFVIAKTIQIFDISTFQSKLIHSILVLTQDQFRVNLLINPKKKAMNILFSTLIIFY